MLNHTFTFNGHTSDEFGIKIERFRALSRPGRKYDAASVPGRNGILYKLQEAWEEILVSYEIFAGDQKNGETLAIWANMNPVTFNDMQYSEKTVQELTFFFPKVLGPVAPNIIAVNINGNETITFPVPMYGGTYDYISGTLIVTSAAYGEDLPEPVIYHLEPHSVITASGANSFGISSPPNATVQKMRIGRTETLSRQWTNIMEWLNSADGYAELYDTFDTDHYRKAVFVDSAEIQNSWNHYGRAVVSFHCRPERFLSGYKNVTIDMSDTVTIGTCTTLTYLVDSPSTMNIIATLVKNTQFRVVSTSGGFYQAVLADGRTGFISTSDATTTTGYEVYNPTNHIAKPVLRLSPLYSGTYSLRINTITMTITPGIYGLPDPVEVNCENEYFPVQRLNSETTLTDIDGNVSPKFLSLQPGYNWFVVGNGFSGISFDANFWEI